MINFKKEILFITILLALFIGSKAQNVKPDTYFNDLIRKNSGGWLAADATYSIKISETQTLWLFGDTFIGTETEEGGIAEGASMIRNSAIFMDGDYTRSLYTGTLENPKAFLPTQKPDSAWYWPEHGIANDTLLTIFFAKIITVHDIEPPWNFKYVGHDIAYFSLPDFSLKGVKELPFYKLNGVMYGTQVLKEGDYTYIYGRKEDSSTIFNLPYVHVARYNGDDSSKWEFYNGNTWVNKPSESKQILDFQVSQQFGVFKYQNKYVLITQNQWLAPEIFSFTSETPVGPWENKQQIYETPILFDGSFTYNAYPHPQFNENNELLISYNTNGDFWEVFKNLELYRPNFIRVPFENIDLSFKPNTIKSNKKVTITASPNPCKSGFNIKIPDDKINEPLLLKIYSKNGKMIKSIDIHHSELKQQQTYINMSDLKSGIYICSLLGENKKHYFKVLKID